MPSAVDTPRPFSVLIVGAGIGGLSAAIALARRGQHVTILEAQPDLNEFGASIAIHAFAVRILQNYGLEAMFKDHVVEDDIEIRDGATNQKIGEILKNKGDWSRTIYGSPHWQNTHRVDYQRILADAAQAFGVKIVFSARVGKVVSNDSLETVHLTDGRQFPADLVVGADGVKSAVRRSIPEVASAKLIPDPEITFRCSVPKSRMRNNPILAPLLENSDSIFWFMEGKYLLCWVMRPDRDFDIATCLLQPEGIAELPVGSWGKPVDPAQVAKHYTDANPVIRALLAEVETARAWQLAELEPLTTCRSSNGRIVLLGDAMHAMLPHNGSGGATAVEDGAVLGECVAWAAENGRPIAQATEAYEKSHMPRARRLQESSGQGRHVYTASGKMKEMRNAGLAAQMAANERELAMSPEERRANLPRPDKDASWPRREYMLWMDSYDAVAETKKYLAQQLSNGA